MDEWQKGDILESEWEDVTFLGYSSLSDECFIGESESGEVTDDYIIDYFRKKDDIIC